MDPTLLNNLLASLRNTIFDVLTQNGTPFQQLGQNIFRTLAIVMIVIAGSRIAFSDHHALHKLRTLAGLVLLVWIMITLYSTPSPLLGGYSFSEAIPKTAFGMSDLVGTTTQQQMLAKLNDISTGIQDMGATSSSTCLSLYSLRCWNWPCSSWSASAILRLGPSLLLGRS